MRVLYLTHSFPRHAGDLAGAFVLRLATALAAENVEVSVLAPATAKAPQRDVIEGVPVSRFRYAPRPLETLAYEGNMASQVQASWGARVGLLGLLGAELGFALNELRGGAFDIVHAHWWFPNGVVGAAASRWYGVPLVTTLHGSDVRLGRAIAPARPAMRQVLRRSARVTAVSRWLATEAQAVAGGELPIVAPMPAATELFSTDRTIRRSDNLLFVGRLTKQKGVDVLLHALAMLPPTVRLDLVGDGEERGALDMLATSLGLGGRVSWHGAKAAAELPAFYRRAVALVVPSADEGLGLVAVEAQLCGAPVIAFASGGVVDVVRHDVTGILVAERTPEALAVAISQLLGRPDRGAALGQCAASLAREQFSPAQAARRYLAIYQQAIERTAR